MQIQCFKTTPYQLGHEKFLSVDQVIPIPETEEFMIRISAKEQEQQTVDRSKGIRLERRRAFWSQLIETLPKAQITLFANISPSTNHWISTGSGISGIIYSLIFGRDSAGIEFYLKRDQGEDNKKLFDYLLTHQDQIEERFGAALLWERLDAKKACRIHYIKEFDSYNQEIWPDIIAWMIDRIPRMEHAFKPEMDNLAAMLKRSY